MASKHILIVDDEPKVGFFLGRALEMTNKECKVSTAHSGEEALDILEKSKVDLLITDLRMPGISGLELIRWVKTSSPKTQTILITAYGSDKVQAEAQRLKIYHYITKPFNVRDFTEVVDKALEQMVMTKPGFAIFSGQAFEQITSRLEDLCNDIGARAIFLADAQGQRLVEVGAAENINTTMLLALLAGGLATSAELARQFNGGESANLNFQKGEHYDVYSANAGDNLIIAMLFDRRTQKSRIGMVWLYTRRAIEDLLTILSSKANESTSNEMLEADFGTSLMAELETAFDGEDFMETPATLQEQEPDLAPANPPTPTPRSTAKSKEPPKRKPAFQESNPPQDQGLLSMEDAIKNGVLPPNFFSD
jgi:CheY-like chemotaxis protein/predicted regulator of Ras-like GTPase activity (Roadblock/LC7/MglB family)